MGLPMTSHFDSQNVPQKYMNEQNVQTLWYTLWFPRLREFSIGRKVMNGQDVSRNNRHSSPLKILNNLLELHCLEGIFDISHR